MTLTQPDYFSFDNDLERLKTIKGASLTRREVDIIACLLSGKGVKSIAALLFMSPRTVETYTRAVMLKFGCHSREEIIEFVERSDQFTLFKNHYVHLLRQTAFKQALQKIAILNRRNEPPLAITLYSPATPKRNAFLHQLAGYLQLVGMQAKVKERISSSLLWTNSLPFVGIICRDDIPILFLLHGPIFLEEVPQEIDQVGYVDFGSFKNDQGKSLDHMYLSFFEVLKILLPTLSLDEIQSAFQRQGDVPAETKEGTLLLKEQPVPSSPFYKKKAVIAVGIACAIFGVLFASFYDGFFKTPASSCVRSELAISHHQSLLDRPHLLAKMKNTFKNQEPGIQSVTLVGPGGAGKTTLARLYARSQHLPVVWEIHAQTKTSLRLSLKDLAYALSHTTEQKDEFDWIEKTLDINEQEKRLLLFIKKRLKEESPWLLIYDNVEAISNIRDFFPQDSTVWGDGKIIITSRDINAQNTSYIHPKSIILVEELKPADALNLFCTILYGLIPSQLTPSQREEASHLLQQIPAFPLDVTIAAYYIKNTQITFNQYLMRIQNFSKEFNQAQESLLKSVNHYAKTRYKIISLSFEEIIHLSPDFKDFLLLICLLDSQNIPKDLLDIYKNATITDQFIYQLKKHSLITDESFSGPVPVFCVHRSVQKFGEQYLIETLNLETDRQFLPSIITFLTKYTHLARENDNFDRMKLLVGHYEKLMTYKNLFNQTCLGTIQGELGALYIHLGSVKKAQPLLEEGLKALSQYDPKNYMDIGQATTYLGCVYRDRGDYHKAKELFKQTLLLYKNHLPPSHPLIAWALVHLSKAYSSLGNYKKSIKHLERSLDIYKQQPVENYAKIAWAYAYLGSVYRHLGSYQKAKDTLEQSLFLYKKHLPNSHSSVASALIKLGIVHADLGNYQKAKALTEQGLSLYEQYCANDHFRIAWSSVCLGAIYRHLKNYAKAQKLIEDGISLYQKYTSDNQIKIGEALIQLGAVYRDSSNPEKAQEILQEALKIFEKKYGQQHVKTANALLELGQVYLLKQEAEKAKSLLNEALEIFQKNHHVKQYECLEHLADLNQKERIRKSGKTIRPILGGFSKHPKSVEAKSQEKNKVKKTDFLPIIRFSL